MLVATVCSSPPEGRKRWTLDLLAGQMVQLTEHEGLSRETVRRQSVIAAGRKVIVQRNAISMPVPAISPSSATPLNAVGTNARNPAAVASAATSMAPPARRAVSRNASATLPVSYLASRKRTAN